MQRTRDTAPELAVRRLLHAMGLRYRVDRQPLPGLRRRADLVFGPARVAVYIDGCFWHGCPEHGNPRPRANSGYWPAKIQRNQARDAAVAALVRPRRPVPRRAPTPARVCAAGYRASR